MCHAQFPELNLEATQQPIHVMLTRDNIPRGIKALQGLQLCACVTCKSYAFVNASPGQVWRSARVT